MCKWISWKHKDTDFQKLLQFEDKVEIFYEQTYGWQLHIAYLLANGGKTLDPNNNGKNIDAIPHSGFAVLSICFSYFELIGSFKCSQNKSNSEKFKNGMEDVSEMIPEKLISKTEFNVKTAEKLYGLARSGLYHEGRTRCGIVLHQPQNNMAIAINPTNTETIEISPERLTEVLIDHLKKFKESLLNKSNDDLRKHFEQRFDDGFTKNSIKSKK